MKPRIVALCVGWLLVFGCAPFYDDSGAPDPASWWPWVCEDGGVAPEGGCPAPPPECDDAGVADDGACLTEPVECDGGLEPDGACPPTSGCADGQAADGDTDGGC